MLKLSLVLKLVEICWNVLIRVEIYWHVLKCVEIKIYFNIFQHDSSCLSVFKALWTSWFNSLLGIKVGVWGFGWPSREYGTTLWSCLFATGISSHHLARMNFSVHVEKCATALSLTYAYHATSTVLRAFGKWIQEKRNRSGSFVLKHSITRTERKGWVCDRKVDWKYSSWRIIIYS